MVRPMSEIGNKIKCLREASGITQRQLAEYLSVDQSMVSKYEAGERSINSEMLRRLSEVFCCPVSVFISDNAVSPSYRVAFRATSMNCDDLRALSAVNKIVLNQLKMDELLGGTK